MRGGGLVQAPKHGEPLRGNRTSNTGLSVTKSRDITHGLDVPLVTTRAVGLRWMWKQRVSLGSCWSAGRGPARAVRSRGDASSREIPTKAENPPWS